MLAVAGDATVTVRVDGLLRSAIRRGSEISGDVSRGKVLIPRWRWKTSEASNKTTKISYRGSIRPSSVQIDV